MDLVTHTNDKAIYMEYQKVLKNMVEKMKDDERASRAFGPYQSALRQNIEHIQTASIEIDNIIRCFDNPASM